MTSLSGRTNLSHDGPQRSRSFGTSVSQRQEEATSNHSKEHFTALPQGARPPVRLRTLSQASKALSVRTSTRAFARPQKILLIDCGDDLLRDDAYLKKSPPQSRSRPAGGSSRSSPSAWQPPHYPLLRRVAHGRSCGPLRRFQGVADISEHVILQLLQNTNDLALKCVTAQIAELACSEPPDGWVGACLDFHHFDVHTRRGDTIWLPS